MSRMPANFCFKPWVELYSHFDTFGPCCVNYKLYKGSIDTYRDSKELKQLKREFLANRRPASCSACWEAEDQGVRSVRQIDNKLKGKDLQTISISLSNKCNFKCRMCNPEDSSAWALDKKACDILNWYDVPTDTDLSTIDWIINVAKKQKLYLRMMGGEPLITNEFLYFLQQLDKYDLYRNIYLILTTNLSVLSYKGVNYLDYFDKFSKIDIYASFDGVGEVGEYIRHGFNFKKFDTNLQDASKFINNLSVTVQLYNIFDMPNIFAYAKKNNLNVNFNYLVEPSFLRIENLNLDDKKAILKHYKDKKFTNKELESALTNSRILNQKPKFLEYTQSLDALWGKNLMQSIPELKILY